jgi:translation initiation factor 1A
MVKNTTGGNKHKKHKNKGPEKVEAKIILAQETQVYAAVIKMMGGKHVSVICSDGETRMCTIEGKHYKRMWIRPNDIILANVETIGLKKLCYLVHKYSLDHINTLRNQGLLNFLDKEQQGVLDDNSDSDMEEEIEDEEETNNYFDVESGSSKTHIANLNDSDDDSEDTNDSSDFYDRPSNYGNYKSNKNGNDEDLFDL